MTVFSPRRYLGPFHPVRKLIGKEAAATLMVGDIVMRLGGAEISFDLYDAPPELTRAVLRFLTFPNEPVLLDEVDPSPLGDARLVLTLPLSSLMAAGTNSTMSHASVVATVHAPAYEGDAGEVTLANVGPAGFQIQRFYDWLDDAKGYDILVMRLKDRTPIADAGFYHAIRAMAVEDPRYDPKFGKGAAGLYCMNAVAKLYADAGYPLQDPIPLNQIKGQTAATLLLAQIGGIEPSQSLYFCGNPSVGVMSDPRLKIVARWLLERDKNIYQIRYEHGDQVDLSTLYAVSDSPDEDAVSQTL